jgi:transposase
MAAYSLDLRKRVLRAWDAGMDAESVAAKYEVSRAWVHRLVQRRRETGSIAPRKQTTFRPRMLADHETHIAALRRRRRNSRPSCP